MIRVEPHIEMHENYSTYNTTFSYINSQTCRVCNGTGLVYGLNGQPYLCPKCDGDGFDKDKTPQPIYPYNPIYPQYYIESPTIAPVTQEPYITC